MIVFKHMGENVMSNSRNLGCDLRMKIFPCIERQARGSANLIQLIIFSRVLAGKKSNITNPRVIGIVYGRGRRSQLINRFSFRGYWILEDDNSVPV